MQVKHCPRCQGTYPLDKFSTRGRRGGVSGWCKACHIVAANEARQQRQRYVNDIKRERGCYFCGRNEPIGLDFHHREAEQKEKAVGVFAASGPFYKLTQEIEKCVVVCAYCHRLLHKGLLLLDG